jgi:hypothetical protein
VAESDADPILEAGPEADIEAESLAEAGVAAEAADWDDAESVYDTEPVDGAEEAQAEVEPDLEPAASPAEAEREEVPEDEVTGTDAGEADPDVQAETLSFE